MKKKKVSSHPTLQFTKIQLSIRDAFSYDGHAYPYMQKKILQFGILSPYCGFSGA